MVPLTYTGEAQIGLASESYEPQPASDAAHVAVSVAPESEPSSAELHEGSSTAHKSKEPVVFKPAAYNFRYKS